MTLQLAESWARGIGAAAGLATLGIALWGLWRGPSRPAGRETGAASLLLRRPVLLGAAILYIIVCALLWRPLPLALSHATRWALLIVGVFLYSMGLLLYLWGARTLGRMFEASSGFGVRLQVGHRLITHGPFSLVRHPMYLALIVAGLGGLLIYHTWTMAFFALNMLGLAFRARREEEALAAEFGDQWAAYARRVPGWIPRLRR